MLAKNRAIQIKKYKQFVEKQDAEQLLSFFEKTNLSSILGDTTFVEWVKAKFFKGQFEKDVPQSKILAPDERTIIKAVCDFYNTDEKAVSNVRRGVQNEPRDVAIYLLRTVCGEPLMRIGHEFGMTQYSSVSSAVNRNNKKRQNDSRFLIKLDEVLELAKKGQT